MTSVSIAPSAAARMSARSESSWLAASALTGALQLSDAPSAPSAAVRAGTSACGRGAGQRRRAVHRIQPVAVAAGTRPHPVMGMADPHRPLRQKIGVQAQHDARAIEMRAHLQRLAEREACALVHRVAIERLVLMP